MVARERAGERCLAAWRRRPPPRTMVYVCQPHVLHVRSRPCHRARGEARRHRQDRRQAHGDPDCPDGRVAHSAHLRKLHSTSCHFRLDGGDLTEYIMKRFSLYPRGKLLWTSQRNSASWHGLRHSSHDSPRASHESLPRYPLRRLRDSLQQGHLLPQRRCQVHLPS